MDVSAVGQRDAGADGQKGVGAASQKDDETGSQGAAGAGSQKDVETGSQGEAGAGSQKDVETGSQGEAGAGRQKDDETGSQGEAGMISQVRRFNRTVTQRIGALDDAFLSRGRPLGQARLLWEIAPDGSDVRRLRSRLGLDSGYLSRLLHSLAGDGLITVDRSAADGRVRMAALTSAGRAERAELDRLSDDAARSILGPLSGRQRDRLITAMADVERLLTASAIELAGTDPRAPAARACQQAYASELAIRFEAGYDPAQTMTMDDADLTPPAGLLLVASLHGEPVGCGAVLLAGAAPAKIRRMWVSPAVRGLGLGRRILAGLEAHAAAAGAAAVRLETNRALTEAIGLYRSAGYREVPPFSDEHYAHHWFEKTLPVSRDRCAGR